MRKISLFAIFVLFAIILNLWTFTKMSTAHSAATKSLFASPHFKSELGIIQTVVLTKYSQKTGPSGKGCTSLTYYVLGVADSDWAHVRLINDGYGSNWKVMEIKKGYNSELSVSCVYG